jgi:hypothetical protein
MFSFEHVTKNFTKARAMNLMIMGVEAPIHQTAASLWAQQWA